MLVLARLSYVATGWHTSGDALLASTAADQARKRRETAREEFASYCREFTVGEAA